MKNLFLAGFMVLSINAFAGEQKTIGATDSNSVFDIISETQAYSRTQAMEIAEISNLSCSYSFVAAAEDNPSNAAICTGDTEEGRIIISQKSGALKLYNILKRYTESKFSFGSSIVKVNTLVCTLDLVARDMDMGDIHVKCGLGL